MTKKMYMPITAAVFVVLLAFTLALALSACGNNADPDPYSQEQDQEQGYGQSLQDENGDVPNDVETDNGGDDSNQQEQDSAIVTPPRTEPPIIDWRAVPLTSTFVPDPNDDFQLEWAADIIQFRQHMFRTHLYFSNPAMYNLPRSLEIGQAFDTYVNALLYRLPYLSEFQILTELQKSLALFDSSALGIWELWDEMDLAYPLWFRWISDGFYLTHAADDFAHALGHRLVRIDNVPIDEVFEMYTQLFGYTIHSGASLGFARNLNVVRLFEALGINDGTQATFSFADADGAVLDINVNSNHPLAYSRMQMYWWAADGTLATLRNADVLPIFEQNAEQDVWHTLLEEYGILYLRIDNVPQNIPGITTIRYIAENYDLNAIVVDVRSQRFTGGTLGFSLRTLFNGFAANAPDGGIFVLVDKNTDLLTGIAAAVHLEELGAAVIGLPPATSLTRMEHRMVFQGTTAAGEASIELTHSGIFFAVPTHFTSFDTGGLGRDFPDNIYTPNVMVEFTIDDWINGRDPWMEMVLEEIGF